MRKPGGTYYFSRLQVVHNHIMDVEHHCNVYLRGFNTAGVEYDDGRGVLGASYFAQYQKLFQMNLWRLNINASWWINNYKVPIVGISYQQWVRQLIGWIEQNGDYVEIDKGPQFDEPPCGGKITFCTNQNTGAEEFAGRAAPGDPDPNDPDARNETSDGTYMLPALRMLGQLASMYKNDPAIIYDTWNEAHSLVNNHPILWQQHQLQLIAAVRQFAPKALVVLPISLDDTSSALHYRQGNLVYDIHVYPNSYYAQNWPQHLDRALAYAHADGDAIIFNEWGGVRDNNPYSNNLINYAIKNEVGLAFYQSSAVLTGGKLNHIGSLVQAEYLSMPG